MPNSKLRMLVLEDHGFQRAIAVDLLHRLGCGEVLQAADGVEALDILQKSGKVDIALCDLQMDGMDGLEFLRVAGGLKLINAVVVSSSASLELRQEVLQVACSSGLDFLGDIGKPLDAEALKNSLEQYLEKQNHKGVRWDEYVDEQVLKDEVLDAFSRQELKTYVQPKFDLYTGEVLGVETQVRWHHPSREVLISSVFIPVLERFGLLDDLLCLQMNQVLILSPKIGELKAGFNFSFKLHMSQLVSGDLVSKIRQVLENHAVPGSSLTFELGEDGLLEAPVSIIEVLIRLRMLGCRLSIDNFGAEFFSLRRLCQLPFNELKLDRDFIHDVKQDPNCSVAIRMALALGESLNMDVVVDGIETQEQHQQFLELGGCLGQGDLYASPMSVDDFLRWIESGPSIKKQPVSECFGL